MTLLQAICGSSEPRRSFPHHWAQRHKTTPLQRVAALSGSKQPQVASMFSSKQRHSVATKIRSYASAFRDAGGVPYLSWPYVSLSNLKHVIIYICTALFCTGYKHFPNIDMNFHSGKTAVPPIRSLHRHGVLYTGDVAVMFMELCVNM